MSLRFRHLNNMGKRVSVPIPADDAGFIGRECPGEHCEGYFKIRQVTGLTGPNLPCHCPYCGHTGPTDEFWTKEQIEYARSVVVRRFTEAVHKDLKSLEFRSRPGGLISLSLEVKGGRPPPIRHYREKALETYVTCDLCTLDYAIYGVFGYCPDCRSHNSLQILTMNHDLILKQVSLARTVDDDDLRRHLIDDALENCVSSFDGFGREACRVRSAHSTNAAKCEKVSFQNLVDASHRLKELFGIDLATSVTPQDWAISQRGFMKRHVLAHRAGVVDARYISETSDPTAVVGRRVQVDATEVMELVASTLRVAKELVRLLPPPS